MNFMIDFAIGYTLTYAALWLLRRHLAKRKARREAELKQLRIKAAGHSAQLRELAQARWRAEWAASLYWRHQQHCAVEAEIEARREAAAEAARQANRNGSIDSSCVEVPTKKRLH